MLESAAVVAFVPTRSPRRARSFYEGILGLRLVSHDQFALVFDAHGVPLRAAHSALTPASS
jgi:catechol 2,3-dioxygenase-like lactoylglutathione lyase family enzyme